LPDSLRAHLELLDLELSVPAETARAGRFGTLDYALSTGDWQTAYDEAVRLAPIDLAAVARLVRLAENLTGQGAPDAAVDVLEQAIDAQTSEPLVYLHLARALVALGRHQDAADALTLVETLRGAEPLSRVA
jgi:predicted Zn-dependent protease